jgi:hypothetical protein
MRSFHCVFIFTFLIRFWYQVHWVWIKLCVKVLFCGFRWVVQGVEAGECSYCFRFILRGFLQKMTAGALQWLFLDDRVFLGEGACLVCTWEAGGGDDFSYWVISCHFRKRINYRDRTWKTCLVNFERFSFWVCRNVCDNEELWVIRSMIIFQTLQSGSWVPLALVFIPLTFGGPFSLSALFFWKVFIIVGRFILRKRAIWVI